MDILPEGTLYNIMVSGYSTTVLYMSDMTNISVINGQVHATSSVYRWFLYKMDGKITFTTWINGVKNQKFMLHDELSIKLCKYLMNKDNVNNKRFADIVKVLLDI